ncbi:MAG: hypothetical protein KAI83_14530 [Thiomargarita sp.]|nr:hypothetical protein [Thiomargarita sp.]
MSQFLWIEDFEYGTKHAKNVFGSILQNAEIPTTKPKLKHLLKDYRVSVELSFLEGLRFIREQLSQVDYIILDIDLIDIPPGLLRYEEQTDLLALLEQFYDYQPHQDKSLDEANYKKAAEQLKPEAGYKLYVELVIALDFPKEHILFCSNHTNEQKHIQSVFKQAKIDLPQTFSKDEKNAVQNWITERRNNPYSVLRRGIIEGCQLIQKHLSNDIPFRQFCTKKNRQNVTAQNMRDYLETLQNFLPRREPSDAKPLYKLFIRTLSHEWEDDFNPDNLKSSEFPDENTLKRQKMFGSIIKCTRNWTAHTQIFDKLCERDVAFLFIVAMRAMFKLSDKTEGYENLLLQLTDKLPKQELKTLIEHPNDLLSHCSKSYSQLFKTYVKVLKKKGKLQPPNPTQLDFSSILKTMQYQDKNNEAQFDYLTGLFQMFWHDLSPITVKSFTPTQNHRKIFFEYEYDFDLNDYGKENTDSFLFELARSIYKRSFPI